MLITKTISPKDGFFKKVTTFDNEKLPLKGVKANRAETLHVSTIVSDGREYNADEDSIRRMGYYLTNASSQYAKAISTGSSGTEAYTECYTNTTVNWKLANNTVEEITIEQLAETYNLAVNNLNSNWT
jgi:hypothetical protein